MPDSVCRNFFVHEAGPQQRHPDGAESPSIRSRRQFRQGGDRAPNSRWCCSQARADTGRDDSAVGREFFAILCFVPPPPPPSPIPRRESWRSGRRACANGGLHDVASRPGELRVISDSFPGCAFLVVRTEPPVVRRCEIGGAAPTHPADCQAIRERSRRKQNTFFPFGSRNGKRQKPLHIIQRDLRARPIKYRVERVIAPRNLDGADLRV